MEERLENARILCAKTTKTSECSYVNISRQKVMKQHSVLMVSKDLPSLSGISMTSVY